MIREQIEEATKFLHSTEVILFEITFARHFGLYTEICQHNRIVATV